MTTARAHSRKELYPQPDPEVPSDSALKIGCLQRIADATELMARSYANLIAERDRYRRLLDARNETCERLERRCSALRGAITRLKRKAKR